MRKYGKVDTNQRLIVGALARVGASPRSLASLGDGCPDLLVGFRGKTYLMEVKSESGTLTQDQTEWIAGWHGGKVHLVRSVDDALAVIGVLTGASPAPCRPKKIQKASPLQG